MSAVLQNRTDGRLCALSSSIDKTIVWRTEQSAWNGSRLTLHSIFCCAISKCGSHFVTVQLLCTSYIWTLDGCAWRCEELNGTKSSHYVKSVTLSEDNGMVLRGHRKTVEVFQPDGERWNINGLKCHSGKVTAVAVSRDKRHIVSASRQDWTVRIVHLRASE